MNKQKFLIAIKWGALLGAGLSLIKLIAYYASTLDAGYPFEPISDLFMVVAFIATIFLTIKEIRDKVQEGVIRFAPAFGYGILVVVCAYFVMVGYLLIHYSFIETDGVAKNNQRNVEFALHQIKNDTITTEELSQYYENVKVLITQEEEALSLDSACAAQVDSATQILLVAYEKQLVQKKHTATDPAFQLDSFQIKADQLLFRCTEAILTNANEQNQDCLANLPIILENSARNREGLNPLVARFEKIKPSIPQSDSPVMAAIAYSLSILLYGLLLNIFVALFLYRNEKRSCTRTEENEEESTVEVSENE